MKIISYSDLHLEFDVLFEPSIQRDADILVLAGDIITFKDYEPLQAVFENWQKPIIYVSGNHEYYGSDDINTENDKFRRWLSRSYPHVHFLCDEGLTINDVHFFGGTMWTDFNDQNPVSMEIARNNMNDYRRIKFDQGQWLRPHHTVEMHNIFKTHLTKWLEEKSHETCVIISHHAPVTNPQTIYTNSALQPAFVSYDMRNLIEQYQPTLWIYGHTHECHDEYIDMTRIISNQRGYPLVNGTFECTGYDPRGCPIAINIDNTPHKVRQAPLKK